MADNLYRTRIKVCGLSRKQDVLNTVNLGVDAIGMVFYPKSKRYISPQQALELRSLIPAFVTFTALFVNPDADQVNQVIKTLKPDLLQFHGDESPEFCASFNWRYIKAFRVGAPGQDTAASLASRCEQYAQAQAWLFDSYTAAYGGSGKSFDDSLLSQVSRCATKPKLILSGGLTTATVTTRLSNIRPFAVDVSSAVESAPGIKDSSKILAFVKAVQAYDSIVK